MATSQPSLLTGRIIAFFLSQLDRRSPLMGKLLALAAILYGLSPIDFIPDVLPAFGFLDDVAIVPLGLFIASKMIPDAVWTDALDRARREARKWIIIGVLLLGVIVLAVGYLAWVVIHGAWAFTVG